MPPASNACVAAEPMDGLEESLEDEAADVDGAVAAGFDSGNLGSLGVGHVGHPADGLADLFEVKIGAVDFIRLPGEISLPDRDEVAGGGSEGDDRSGLTWEVAKADQVVNFGNSLETLGEIGRFGLEDAVSQPQCPDGIASAEQNLPAGFRSLGCCEFGRVSAWIDDGEARFVSEHGVVGDRHESELSFVVAREDFNRCALGISSGEECVLVCRDPDRHGGESLDVAASAVLGLVECGFDGCQAVGHAFFAQDAGGFRASAESGHPAPFADGLPSSVNLFLANQEDRV